MWTTNPAKSSTTEASWQQPYRPSRYRAASSRARANAWTVSGPGSFASGRSTKVSLAPPKISQSGGSMGTLSVCRWNITMSASAKPLKEPEVGSLIPWALAQSLTSDMSCTKRPSISLIHCRTADFSTAVVLDRQRSQEMPVVASTNFKTGTLAWRTFSMYPLEVLDTRSAPIMSLRIETRFSGDRALNCFGVASGPLRQVPSIDRSRSLAWLPIPDTKDPYGTTRKPVCCGKALMTAFLTRSMT
mmetsp:Transcript_14356/g.34013  ORF Transcript_14356/g.34013 Transcript_14356/m.34013 type:complete len:245 (-) Transcript_14356:759-1493(-)